MMKMKQARVAMPTALLCIQTEMDSWQP